MWLLAIPTQSIPASARPAISFGSAEKTVPRRVVAEGVRGRVLEVRDRDVGRLDQVADGAGFAGPAESRGRSQPSGEQSLQRDGDVGGAAVEREVGALALDLQRLGDAPVEHDVAAGDERPRGRRVEDRRVAALRQLRASGPTSATVFTASTPNRRAAAPAEGPDARADRIGPEDGRGACGAPRGPS